MKTIFAIISISLAFVAGAQKAYPPLDIFPWKVRQIFYNSRYEFDTYNFSQGFLYTKNDEVIASVHKSEPRYDPKGGIVKFNSSGKILWQQFAKTSQGVARFDNKIVTFDLHKSEENKKELEITGLLLDPDNGKILTEKSIAHFKSEFTLMSMITDEQHNFHALSYCTPDNGTYKDINLIYFDNKFSIINQKTFSFNEKNSFYAGMGADKDGNIYIGYLKDFNVLVLDKLDKKGEVLRSIEIPANWKVGTFRTIRIQADEINANQLLVNWTYYDKDEKVPVNLTAKYDFDMKTVKVFKEVYNNEFERNMKDRTANNKSCFDLIDFLKFQRFALTKDKVISIKEIKNSAGNFYNGGIVITILNKDMQNPQYYIIPRGMIQSYTLALSTGCHIRNNILYLPVVDNKSGKKYSAYLFTIDLETGKQEIKEIDKFDSKPTAIVEPDATFWFKDNLLLNYGGFENAERYSFLQKVDY